MNEAMTVAEQRATEVADIGEAMKATAMAGDGAQVGAAMIRANWPADMADDPGGRDEPAMLTIMVGGFPDFDSDTVGMPDADPVVMPNAGNIDGR